MTKLYLAFDPGNTTGWAVLNDRAIPQDMGQVSFDGLADFLKKETRTFEAIIIEEYRVFRRKAMQHAGSDLRTSQVIGKLKFWAELNETPVVMQAASILPTAEKWAQIKMPKDHSISHQISAVLHGSYYLMKNEIAPTALERRAIEDSKKKKTLD